MPVKNARKPFGDLVKAARVKTGMTLRELARRIDKSPSYVNDIEYNRRTPSEQVVRDLCDVLDLDVDVMLAAAGRVGVSDDYLRSNPTAGVLLRRAFEAGLGEEDLDKLVKHADRIAKQRRDEDQ
jgi:transcriptional regulator with XRE-family HTH domain